MKTEIGATLCAIGAGRTLTFLMQGTQKVVCVCGCGVQVASRQTCYFPNFMATAKRGKWLLSIRIAQVYLLPGVKRALKEARPTTCETLELRNEL